MPGQGIQHGFAFVVRLHLMWQDDGCQAAPQYKMQTIPSKSESAHCNLVWKNGRSNGFVAGCHFLLVFEDIGSDTTSSDVDGYWP